MPQVYWPLNIQLREEVLPLWVEPLVDDQVEIQSHYSMHSEYRSPNMVLRASIGPIQIYSKHFYHKKSKGNHLQISFYRRVRVPSQ